MIVSLSLLLLCQLFGEILARGLALPLPGPVIGMALLLGAMALRDRHPGGLPKPLVDGTLESTSKGLLGNLSLLFVPAGVGVVGRLDVLRAQGPALAVTLVVSTLAALVATAVTFAWISRRVGR
ncbi:LrgA family protein [Methylobacterium sp. 4-46]|uniref:CidA/LrgA family protein n=1 Tax=unclassified Methylobacterium TaxID=2615210 RepID=UPI000165C9B3|nr:MULTISPECIES: CidA/LrgA family protein [Methylobacterium]ACA16337.1 LrgA family protein [Methylobacterium sp. 4-46]WFT82044.1 CidA/LrgA family protein [Methylobacterium nodulans]